jgi:hypothetical protein
MEDIKKELKSIMQEFEPRADTLEMEIRAKGEDVRRYLDEKDRMSALPYCVKVSPELQEEIKTAIIQAVDGMCVPSHAVLIERTS